LYGYCFVWFDVLVSTYARASVIYLFFAMQDFADEKVKDEVLLEDEKEKFKVHINFILKSS
jgi:hypothetical protein